MRLWRHTNGDGRRASKYDTAKLSLLLMLGCPPAVPAAQTLSGSVKDNRGSPVAQATVYIEELQQGAATDADGAFRLRLPEGQYTCVFRCVGYTSVTERIAVPKSGLTLNIVMPIQAYDIGAVIVSKNREDPAYSIMRQVIGMAPYYSNQVDYYQANVYIKGSAKIDKISRIVKALGGKEFREGLKTVGKHAVILESLNEITFRAPKSFHHKVISTSSSLPMDFKGLNTLNFVQTNIYQTNIVARDAFKNYRFAYEGVSEDNGLTINKIKVTPIVKNPALVSGYVYIIDGSWHIYSVDLQGKAPFGNYKMSGNCYQIRPDVYLPAAFKIEGEVDMLGNKFTASYQLSLKYTEVTLNTKLANPLRRASAPKPAPKPQPALPKMPPTLTKAAKKAAADSVKRVKKKEERQEKINALLEKEDFTNRDMNRLAKLMEETAQETQGASLDLSSHYKVEVDTNSRKMDAAAWDTLRPVELNAAEVSSYKYADTLQQILDADPSRYDTSRSRFLNTIGRGVNTIGKFFGGAFYFNNRKSWVRASLFDINSIKFNPVDGFRYGIYVRLRHEADSGRQVRLTGRAAWAFARQAVRWEAEAQWRYLPHRRAWLTFSAGIANADYNPHRNADDVVFSYSALLTHNNYTRLYDHFYARLRNEIDISNGLMLMAQVSFADRCKLQNHTNFAFLFPHRRYAPNEPYNALIGGDFPLYRTMSGELALVYTPEYFYRMRGRQKVMVRSKYPTFTLRYKKALPNLAGSQSDYDMLAFKVNQSINAGFMRRLWYDAEVAGFVSSRRVDFTDFYHFNVQGFAIAYPADNSYADRYYKYATNRWGAAANAGYVSPLVALKYLPYFSETYCRENLKWHGHYSPQGGFYNDFYYGISEILLFMEVGVFVGFENARFSGWGVGVKLNL